MLQDQRLWVLVGLKLCKEATPQELEELDALLQENPEYLQRMALLEKLWKSSNQGSTAEIDEAFDRHLQRLNNQAFELPVLYVAEEAPVEELKPAGRKSWKKYSLWLGAAIAASVLLFWFFGVGGDAVSKPLINTISTNNSSKANINLPDGSRVLLNKGSKITYSGDFQGRIREVFLSGEAFFDVAKDKTRPFIIHAKSIDLKVLGTSFNVRSYDDDKETETALVHGSIEVMLRDNPDQKIILKPGEKLVVKNNRIDSSSLSKKEDNPQEEMPIAILSRMRYYGQDSSNVETSWTKKQLIFEKEHLAEIALKIERWYNVKVIIKDQGLRNAKYTAIFEEETLEEVMEALRITGGFQYTIKNKEVVIRF
jgi:transmembrane sensor